ncbi:MULTISPECIES: hypothetical protein [unclassified Micromonospora]|uniref:hypothetical protein n=1 Tax=unclassified Micromonospora TaxID=2617518 RepID=UPI0036318534
MGDSGWSVDRAVAGADFLEWNFSIRADGSPWSVEQAMTQLLAYQSAEGLCLRLAVAAREDATIIHELGRRRTPQAVAALRAFEAMSPIDTQRELARANADRLVGQGLPEPAWGATIGRVRLDGCWWAHDEFAETVLVLCAFSYQGDDAHGILLMIDRVIEGGLVRQLTLGTDPDLLRAALRDTTDTQPGFVTEPLDPAYARRLIEDAVATSDEVFEDQGYDPSTAPPAYRKMRALILARARALSADPAPPEPLPDSVELDLVKRAFLASAPACGLPVTDVTVRAVDLLVAHVMREAGGHPVRLGPRRVLAVLGLPDLTPDELGDPDVGRVLPDVAEAWVSWTAAERGLPGDAAQRLVRAAREACEPLRSGPGPAAG